MARIEQVDQGAVLPFDHPDLQVAHEPAGGQPEVVADQDEGLDMLAIALPEGVDQVRARLTSPGEEPLLELVEDDQHLVPGAEHAPAS